MRGRKGFTLIELLVVIAIIAVLAAILFPVFAKARSAAKASNCQSNFKQIGNAIKMYLSDWEDTFPTNRPIVGGTLQPKLFTVTLSEVDSDTYGNPVRFVNGLAWVEALYGHIEPAMGPQEASSVWRCQAASNKSFPLDHPIASITYVFNFTLCEKPEGIIKGSGNLMMVREVDRLVNSVCRPTNDSTGNQNIPPQNAFLDSKDEQFPDASLSKMHGTGSHILFADGHVKNFPLQFFPDDNLTAATSWSSVTNQWFNYKQGAPGVPSAQWETIAITP